MASLAMDFHDLTCKPCKYAGARSLTAAILRQLRAHSLIPNTKLQPKWSIAAEGLGSRSESGHRGRRSPMGASGSGPHLVSLNLQSMHRQTVVSAELPGKL